MKTNEFIRQCAHAPRGEKPRTGSKRVASILWDGETIYSYGQHYPLLFKLEAPADHARGFYWVCNDRGHSVTTSKHIGQARQYADFCVNLPRGSRYTEPRDIVEACQIEIKEKNETIRQALQRQIERPRYEHVYQRTIDEMETRIEQLKQLISAASAAISAPDICQ